MNIGLLLTQFNEPDDVVQVSLHIYVSDLLTIVVYSLQINQMITGWLAMESRFTIHRSDESVNRWKIIKLRCSVEISMYDLFNSILKCPSCISLKIRNRGTKTMRIYLHIGKWKFSIGLLQYSNDLIYFHFIGYWF